MKEYIKKRIRRYLVEELILNENVKQAEKLLKVNNIPLDNINYNRIKNLLIKSNNVGYLGLIVKLSINSGSLSNMNRIYSLIQDNKPLLNKLPKQLQSYSDFNILQEDITKLKHSMLLKKLTNKLTNSTIKSQLLLLPLNDHIIENIEYFLNLKSSDQKEFLSKSDKYNTTDEFISDLEVFNEDIRTGFTYGTVISKISNLGENEIKVLFKNEVKQLILVRVLKYSASKMIGSQSWCIVGDEKQFNHYTEYGKNYQYFLFNFNPNIPTNEKMIAFTMNNINEVTAAHDRYDNTFNSPINYLNKIGIHKKVVELNTRERKENVLNNLGLSNKDISDEYYDRNILITTSNDYYKDKTFDKPNSFTIKFNKIGLNFLSLLVDDEAKGKNHLDIIFKKFESYPLIIYDYKSKEKIKQKINIIKIALHNIDEILSKYDNNIITKKEIINIMTKIYLSNIKMFNETKHTVLHFLRGNNVDILKLAQQKKSKTNQDLGDMEFAMLKNRGENLKPIIQNKLYALRRGENINLTISEIKYAIENGLKPIIEKHYKQQIPLYIDHQLSYDDMTIYKELGLLKDVAKVIYQKGEQWGVDALNSIENSIYSLYNKTYSIW